MTSSTTFEDVTGCQTAFFEWADSYDAKDWDRLHRCIAPFLKIDYTSFIDKKWSAMPAGEFVQMVSSPHFLGNNLIKTQHLIGMGTWKKIAECRMEGNFQLRVAHQKYKDDETKEVDVKGHDHGTATVWFERIDGTWKFAGIQPNSRWAEFDMKKIFI